MIKKLEQSNVFRKLVIVFIDIIQIIAISFLALYIRFDFESVPDRFLEALYKSIPWSTLIYLIILYLSRVYNVIWTFYSEEEIGRIFKVVLFGTVSEIVLNVVLYLELPRSYYLIKFIGLLISMILVRMILKNLLNYFRRKDRDKNEINVMIVGAGAAGSLIIDELNVQEEKNYKVVALIDDNPAKLNKRIRGVKVLGGREQMVKIAEKYSVDEIIIALPSAGHDKIKELVLMANDTNAKVRILEKVHENLTQSLISSVREASYEDLLGRDSVSVDDENINKLLENKVVLVTGGGGTIGSELCRQIVEKNIKELIIFDIYENNAYEIQMELERKHPDKNITTLIGSVRDYDRLDYVFKTHKPNLVFHAAAHKHVPLMEVSPNEAIKNNCAGTLNTVKLADKYKVDKFILISTDKAVRPTNLMGATKRMCEMIVQSYNKKSKTEFVAVRFGNVLGSNGSVIPLFLKQIREGGPVTVTHKDITRFFMTVLEAVTLILQAAVYAEGGEIFVLDMGQPVKIYDLAERLIRLAGFIPHEEIQIQIVGLRPGEKLYEEVLMEEEGLQKTENKLIFIAKPIEMDDKKFLEELDDLIKEAYENKNDIKAKAELVCPTYTPDQFDAED